MIKPFITFNSTSWYAHVVIQAASPFMVTTSVLSNAGTPLFVCASAGLSAMSAGVPMHCCFPRLFLILRFPPKTRQISSAIPALMVIFPLSWIILLPLMKAVSGLLSGVSGCTGNSACCLSPLHPLRTPASSDAVFLLSGVSSCR